MSLDLLLDALRGMATNLESILVIVLRTIAVYVFVVKKFPIVAAEPAG